MACTKYPPPYSHYFSLSHTWSIFPSSSLAPMARTTKSSTWSSGMSSAAWTEENETWGGRGEE